MSPTIQHSESYVLEGVPRCLNYCTPGETKALGPVYMGCWQRKLIGSS